MKNVQSARIIAPSPRKSKASLLVSIADPHKTRLSDQQANELSTEQLTSDIKKANELFGRGLLRQNMPPLMQKLQQ